MFLRKHAEAVSSALLIVGATSSLRALLMGAIPEPTTVDGHAQNWLEPNRLEPRRARRRPPSRDACRAVMGEMTRRQDPPH